MSKPTIDIDRVVREVLAELGAAPSSEEGGKGRGAGDEKANKPDLVITSRVVTMAEVAGRLESVHRLVLSNGAVVTPAVRDELSRRGIALEYGALSEGRSMPAVRLVVITSGTEHDPAALIAALAREGLRVERSDSDCLIDATDRLAGELAKPHTLGVLLTVHTAAGLCLANRLRGVRAVTGGDAAAVAAATAAVGANLLITDPRAGTFFQTKQTLAEFCRGGIRPCPEHFRGRLA